MALTTTPVSSNSIYYTEAQKNKTNEKTNELTMQDFFTLMAAQMQNQDMLSPVDNTQFIAQMAQFSSLTAMQELSASFGNFMAVSYVGANIKAQQIDSIGNTVMIEGIAEKVEFIGGETYITVDGKRVVPSEITEVSI